MMCPFLALCDDNDLIGVTDSGAIFNNADKISEESAIAAKSHSRKSFLDARKVLQRSHNDATIHNVPTGAINCIKYVAKK